MQILAKQRLKAYSDEYLSPIDQAIKDYVSSEMLAYKLHEYIDEAIKKYPNRRSMTLYRGLNFLNKEQGRFSFNRQVDAKRNGRCLCCW